MLLVTENTCLPHCGREMRLGGTRRGHCAQNTRTLPEYLGAGSAVERDVHTGFNQPPSPSPSFSSLVTALWQKTKNKCRKTIAASIQIDAGIQIPARILKSWGLLDAIRAYSIEPKRLLLRAYRVGALLSDLKIVPDVKQAYGTPWLLIHRADFQKVLAEEAEWLSAKIRLGCVVTRIACSCASMLVLMSAGVDVRADVVLGADGLFQVSRNDAGILRAATYDE